MPLDQSATRSHLPSWTRISHKKWTESWGSVIKFRNPMARSKSRPLGSAASQVGSATKWGERQTVQLKPAYLVVAAVLALLLLAIWGLFRRWQAKALPHSPVHTDTDSPILTFVGGARLLSDYSMPMGKLQIWDRGISLSALGVVASATWAEIEQASLIRPALIPVGSGVEFRTARYLPLIYWGQREKCLQVLQICADHGVRTDDSLSARL